MNRSNLAVRGGARGNQLHGLDVLDVLVEGDRGLRLIREGVARRVRHVFCCRGRDRDPYVRVRVRVWRGGGEGEGLGGLRCVCARAIGLDCREVMPWELRMEQQNWKRNNRERGGINGGERTVAEEGGEGSVFCSLLRENRGREKQGTFFLGPDWSPAA